MSQRDAYFQDVVDDRDRTSVGVYQTSQTYYSEDRLSDKRPQDFRARGLSFSSWAFAFEEDSSSLCGRITSMSDLALDGAACGAGLTPDVPQAMIRIDTSRTYQVGLRRLDKYACLIFVFVSVIV